MIDRSSARAHKIKNFSLIKNRAVAQSLLNSLQDLSWQSEALSLRGLPIIVMNPSRDDLTHSAHTAAYAYWNDRRSDEQPPAAIGIDPHALRPALGWITLLQPIDDGEDFICRLFGSELVWRFDLELTGKRASAAMDPLAPFLIACCRACMAACGPVLVHCQINDPLCDQGSCLLLPWADDSGAVTRIMAVVGLRERAKREDDPPHSALVRFKR